MKTRMPFAFVVAALGLWLTSAVPPLRAVSNPSENAQTESTWGEPVQGVQVRLRAQNTNWSLRAVPRVFLDIRNQGTRHLLVQKQMHGFEVEVDREWFRRPSYTREVRAKPSPFPPGGQFDRIILNLDGWWEKTVSEDIRRSRRSVPERLRLAPGKHTVRVAVTATADEAQAGEAVRAVSNPLIIEIMNIPAAPGAVRDAQAANPPTEHLTPGQLLDRYEAAQHRTYRSFISRFESARDGYLNQHTVLEPGQRKSQDVVEIRSDGHRYFWCEERSGQCFPRLSETTPAGDPRVKWFLYDGQRCYSSGHEPFWVINKTVQKLAGSERLEAFNDRLAVTISDYFDSKSEFALQFGTGTETACAGLPDSLGTGGLFAETGLMQKLRKARTCGRANWSQ